MADTPQGISSSPYRGEDRRRIAGPVQPPYGRPYVLGVVVVLALWLTFSFVVDLSPAWDAPARERIRLLQVASFVVASAVAGLAFSRWYLTSDAPTMWIAVALTIWGTARLLAVELVPVIFDNGTV